MERDSFALCDLLHLSEKFAAHGFIAHLRSERKLSSLELCTPATTLERRAEIVCALAVTLRAIWIWFHSVSCLGAFFGGFTVFVSALNFLPYPNPVRRASRHMCSSCRRSRKRCALSFFGHPCLTMYAFRRA